MEKIDVVLQNGRKCESLNVKVMEMEVVGAMKRLFWSISKGVPFVCQISSEDVPGCFLRWGL